LKISFDKTPGHRKRANMNPKSESDDRLVTTHTLYVSASTAIVFSSPRAASSRKKPCYGLDAVELVRDSDA
jgi:hypothetical protein